MAIKSTTLRTSSQLAGVTGFCPFAYTVEFSTSNDPTQFASDSADAYERVVDLVNISTGYGVNDGYVAMFNMWDPTTTETTGTGDTVDGMLQPPQNGDIIRIWINNGTQSLIVFKGTITSVRDKYVDGGKTYSCSAVSFVKRLNDYHVTLMFNFQNNPFNPSPQFDNNEFLVNNRKKNVVEIVTAILLFQDAWNSTPFFTTASINWNGLDTDPRCGLYVPGQQTLENEPKGDAIRKVLQEAGNFEFIYDPATDKLVICEINLLCNKCGPLWPIRFPNENPDGTVKAAGVTTYAYETDVKTDETTWQSLEIANVCRIVSNRLISWYTGHYFVPNCVPQVRTQTNSQGQLSIVTDGNGVAQLVPNSERRNAKQVVKDSPDMQMARATNFEGCYYRFDTPGNIGADRRKWQTYVTGIALFPNWNVHESFLPAIYEIRDVALPQEWFDQNGNTLAQTPDAGNPPTHYAVPTFGGVLPPTRAEFETSYKRFCEWRNISNGDAVNRGEAHLGRLYHLRGYQAWETDRTGPCPACQGSGAVAAVYSGAANEPNITWVQGGERVYPVVTNYIFNPAHFATIDPNTIDPTTQIGTMYPPGGLTPFAWGTFPLPYKNLCPYCRGVGLKPLYPIRNILPALYEGRNDKAMIGDAPIYEGDVLDLDTVETQPETWTESVKRIVQQFPPHLCKEASLDMPDGSNLQMRPWQYSNYPVEAIPAGNDPIDFDHPLNFSGMRKYLADYLNLPAGQGLLVDPSWRAIVSYTTITCGSDVKHQIDQELGQVIFEEPVFISCRKQHGELKFTTTGPVKVFVGQNGLLDDTQVCNGTYDDLAHHSIPLGFWRPSRVWIQCLYEKPRHYDTMASSVTQQIITPTPDGTMGVYGARAMIVDGKYCLEVGKVNPTNANGQVELGSANRIIQTVVTDPDAVIEIYPDDFYANPVPPLPDMSNADLKTYKTGPGNYTFPQGVILAWHQHSPGEKMVEAEGMTGDDTLNDFVNSTIRPRMYQWSFRDDRSRMLGKAIRQLELQNNILVNGALQVVNIVQSFATGLGYVNYPNRGLATVKRVTYEFREGFTASLELTREEARFGKPVMSEKDKMNLISGQMAVVGSLVTKAIQKQRATIDQQTNSQKAAVQGVLY